MVMENNGGWGNDYGETYGTAETTSVTVTATSAAATATVPTPAVTSRITATATATAATATTTVPTPSLTTRITATVAPATATATTTAPTPTPSTTLEPTITTGSTTATATSPTPSVTSRITATVTPSTATATTTGGSVTIGSSTGIAATTASATTPAPSPTIAADQHPTTVVSSTAATTSTAAPNIESRKPTTVTVTSTDTATATGGASVTTIRSPTISVDSAQTTAPAPAPTTYIERPAGVNAPTAFAVPSMGAVEFKLQSHTRTRTAFAFASAEEPTVVSDRHSTVTAAATGATTSASPVTIDTDNNGLAVVGEATATVSVPYAAPNPSHATVTPPRIKARAEAITNRYQTNTGYAWGDGTWGSGMWGGDPTVTEELTVTARYPSVVRTAESTATATADPPSHVEAVAPITSLPAALEGQGAIAEVEATVSPGSTLEASTVEPAKPDNQHYRETDTTDRAEFAEPQQRAFGTQDASVYTPSRTLYIGGQEITVDRDMYISAGEMGFSVADITLYNLDVATWREISETDRVVIELGWDQSNTHRVFDGHVLIKRRRNERQDRAYILRARERGAQQVSQTYPETFNGMSPHRIVEHIAMDVDGLKPGFIATGSERLESAYTLSSSKQLRGWLDRLALKAEKQTGTRWVWYLEGQELSFHPVDEQATEHIELGMDKSVLRATPVGMLADDPSLRTYELSMRAEPLLERGVAVTVTDANQIDPLNLFRVAEYTHDSSTTTGRHHTTAVIAPLSKQIEYPSF